MKAWKAFRHLHPKAIEATKEVIKRKLWRSDVEVQREALQEWANKVALVYGITPPTVVLDPLSVAAGNGFYNASNNSIILPYYSVMTLLHTFRYAMQHQGAAGDVVQEDDTGEARVVDAAKWSMSLFYKSAPRRFKRMAREGRIIGVPSDEFGAPPALEPDSGAESASEQAMRETEGGTVDEAVVDEAQQRAEDGHTEDDV